MQGISELEFMSQECDDSVIAPIHDSHHKSDISYDEGVIDESNDLSSDSNQSIKTQQTSQQNKQPQYPQADPGFNRRAITLAASVTICSVLTAVAAKCLDGAFLFAALFFLVGLTIWIASIITFSEHEAVLNKVIDKKKHDLGIADEQIEQRARAAANGFSENSYFSTRTLDNDEIMRMLVTAERIAAYEEAGLFSEDEMREMKTMFRSADMSEADAESLAELSQAFRAYGQDDSFRFEIDENDERRFEKQFLNELFEDAAHSDDMKTALIQNIAHEIKTPLTSLRLISDGISDGFFSTDDDYTKSTINENVARIDTTVKMMTQYAMCQTTNSNGQTGDAYTCFIETVEKAKNIAAGRDGINIRSNVDGFFNEEVEEDERRVVVSISQQSLSTVLSAFIINCFQHAQDLHEISISMKLSTHPTGSGVSCANIVVADDGSGVTPEMAAKMCEPFWKADESHALAHGEKASPGLGLSIAQGLVEEAGGKLEISCLNGTTVSIWVPLASE